MADDFAISVATPDRVLAAQIKQVFNNSIINDLNIEDIDPSNSYAFPRESSGTTRIRYPALVQPTSAPASNNFTNGNMSLIPYFIASNISASSISAISNALSGSGGAGLVGLYSVSEGVSSGTLVAESSYTTTTTPGSKTVTLTLTSGEIQRGWYLVCAVNTAGTVSNSGSFAVYNQGVLGSLSSGAPAGTYAITSSLGITSVTSLPSSLSASTVSAITATSAPSFFLVY
jgi:hypothetical protein